MANRKLLVFNPTLRACVELNYLGVVWSLKKHTRRRLGRYVYQHEVIGHNFLIGLPFVYLQICTLVITTQDSIHSLSR